MYNKLAFNMKKKLFNDTPSKIQFFLQLRTCRKDTIPSDLFIASSAEDHLSVNLKTP